MISPSTMNAMMLAQERTDLLRRAERNFNHLSQPRARRSLHLPALFRLHRRTAARALVSPPRGA